MIKRLSILNFQSHAKTELEFSPGVNIIVGNSDSGKTAIIRAMRWLIWNRPSGDSIRSSWGGDTRVQLELQENVITRSKDKLDKYCISTNGSNKRESNNRENTEFKAFGTSIPEEISRFLNINEINLQQQLDSPFLISKSPGEVAQHFNKVAGLDKIDASLQKVNSWIREFISDIKYKEIQITSSTEELQKFEYLEKFEIDVEVLERMESRLNTQRSGMKRLEELLCNANEISEQIIQERKILKIELPLNEVLNWIEDKKNAKIKWKKLYDTIHYIKDTQEDIEVQSQIIKAEKSINILLGLFENKKTVNSERMLLSKAVLSLRNTNIALNTAEASHQSLYTEFNRVFPDKCPLCGLPTPHDH